MKENFDQAWHSINTLNELAARQSIIHRLHPVVKLITTMVFLMVVASFSKYDLSGLMPLFLFPAVLISLADLPAGLIFRQSLMVAPVAIIIGLFNPLFDRTPQVTLGIWVISGGWLSFGSILLRVLLTTSVALVLVATTGFDQVCAGLNKLGLPRTMVVQMLLIFRYLSVLLEETGRTIRGCALRSVNSPGIPAGVWGSLVGQLLIRSVGRAQRIYQAMLCRGFNGQIKLGSTRRVTLGELGFLVGWSGFFILARCYNITQLLGQAVTEAFK